MTKAMLQPQWDYLRMLLKNVRKQVELVPEGKLDFRPTAEVRTLGELCVHLHEYLTEAPDSVAAGKHVEHEVPKFTSKAELLKWIDAQVEKGFATFAGLSDQQIAGTIKAWGEDFPAWKMLSFVHDEVLHHRGQLTVYLRLLGITPVFIYDF
jgi:uncharacterized damage-inducible protein DinB